MVQVEKQFLLLTDMNILQDHDHSSRLSDTIGAIAWPDDEQERLACL